MGNCCGNFIESVTHSNSQRRAQGWRATGVVGLRDEKLRELPLSLRDIGTRLTAIDASVNHIRSLPSFLNEFSQLQRLILSRNELVTMPESLGQLQQLKVLILDFNKISTFPVCLCELIRLEKLSMISNCLTMIPEEMGQLKNLKDVNFSDNRIAHIGCDFQQLINLELLNLSNNNIEELPVSLRFCVRLKELHCDRNGIRLIPSEIFVECRSLRTLSLNENPINIETLEATEGYKEFEKRRREKANKAISSQVMLGDGTLNEAISRST